MSLLKILVICGISLCQGENSLHGCINDFISILCSEGAECLINVRRAIYWHRLADPSNCSAINDACASNASDVWRRCHGKPSCDFYVRQQRSAGVCLQSNSFALTIDYSCNCSDGCSSLGDPPNGFIQYSDPYLSAGTDAIFGCQNGFHLIGSPKRTCSQSGQWTGISPICTLPKAQICPMSKFHTEALSQSTCYEFVEKSLTWEDATDDCAMKGGSIARISSKRDLELVTWWLLTSDAIGFVWINVTYTSAVERYLGAANPPDFETTCPELDFDVTSRISVKWSTKCTYLNQYVCQYHHNGVVVYNDSSSHIERDLALGLGIGLGVGLLLIIVGATIFAFRRRNTTSKDEDPYSTVHPQSQSQSTSNTSTDDSDFHLHHHHNLHVSYNKPDSVHSFTTAEDDSLGSPDEPEAVYDDVYSCEVDVVAEIADQENEDTPPVDRATKHTKHKSIIRPFTDYENVMIHNLTESLKRKLVPRRVSRLRASESSSSIGPLCKQPSTEKSLKKPYPAMKPKPDVDLNKTLKTAEIRCPSLELSMSCRSSGMEVHDNEIYQNAAMVDIDEI